MKTLISSLLAVGLLSSAASAWTCTPGSTHKSSSTQLQKKVVAVPVAEAPATPAPTEPAPEPAPEAVPQK